MWEFKCFCLLGSTLVGFSNINKLEKIKVFINKWLFNDMHDVNVNSQTLNLLQYSLA